MKKENETIYLFQVRNLLYDPTSGIYYSYDSANQKYEFYCQTSPNVIENNQTTAEDSINKDRIASRRKYWKKKLVCLAQILNNFPFVS